MVDNGTRGEDGLIQETFAPLASGFAGAFGLKDDCALYTPPAGMDLVFTTDAVAEGVHFFSDDTPADIGWKALAVNVSDLIAKGAKPVAYLLAVSFPERPPASWLKGFQAGLRDAQTAFGISLAGGDTDRRPGPLSITVTAFGIVEQGRFVRRGGGKAGDVLFVSGSLGASHLGLQLREAPERAVGLGLDAAGMHALIQRYLRPQPPLGLAPVVASLASAAMDLSDGLVKDCGRMAQASGVAALIDAVRVPLSEAAHTALSTRPELLASVLSGGDDYEVLAAVPPGQAPAFRERAMQAGVTVSEIGRLADGAGVRVLDSDGREIDLKRTGWDHFP